MAVSEAGRKTALRLKGEVIRIRNRTPQDELRIWNRSSWSKSLALFLAYKERRPCGSQHVKDPSCNRLTDAIQRDG